jgi:hypothetical protein
MLSEYRDSDCPRCRASFGVCGFSRLQQTEELTVSADNEPGRAVYGVILCHRCRQVTRVQMDFTPARRNA